MANLDTVKLDTGCLQALTYAVPFGPLTQQSLSWDLPAPTVDACWEPLTQRLLGYLARPFKKEKGSLLHTWLSTTARELSGCQEAVVLAASEDARGSGAFEIVTRFEPISAVAAVARVDGGGATLETYAVTGFDGRRISLTGSKAPGQGDRLRVSYTYLHKGLELRVREALLELNILTATGDWLDEWGRWFNTPRLATGKYGTVKYGGGKYGTSGRESDTQYSRRIIDKIKQRRNTVPAIIEAVKRVTGGEPYIVEWFGAGASRGWVYKVTEEPYWTGAADPQKHLIWGQTSRFLTAAVAGGGPCTIEVWMPQGTGHTAEHILQIVNQYKAAGIQVFIRYQPSSDGGGGGGGGALDS